MKNVKQQKTELYKMFIVSSNVVMETIEYFFCPVDSYGQRTGEVLHIYLFEHEITNLKGLLYYGHTFLFTDYFEAYKAAQN